MQKETILVTGFDAFGDHDENPSGLLAQALDGKLGDAFQIKSTVIPVVAHSLARNLAQAVQEHQPQKMVFLGLAASRTHITPEKIAINFCSFPIADEAGGSLQSQAVIPGAEDGIFANLDVDRFLIGLRKHDFAAELSYSAGTFLCNQLFFLGRKLYPQIEAAFVHVPPFDQVSQHLQEFALMDGFQHLYGESEENSSLASGRLC